MKDGTSSDWRPAGVLGDLLPGELNDACCWACSGGGDVVCCDGCRAVFHMACINLESLPEDDWFCPLCSCTQCQGPCKTLHPAISMQAELIPARAITLPARQSPETKLPNGPGYICPQQLRLWLQGQPPAELANGTQEQQQEQQQEDEGEQAAATGAGEGADKQAAEPKAKRQKRDPVLNSGSTTTAAAGAATTAAALAGDSSSVSADTYIRCSCCQRSCHVACLPAEQQQHLAAWAAAPPDSGGRDQNARSSRRIRSPRGQKKQQQAKQAASEQEQQQQEEYQRLCRPVQPYFCSPGCKQTATELAKQCARGVVQLEALADGTPVCWHLIQPAAVAAALAAAAAPAPAAQSDSSSTPATADAAAAAAAAPASVAEARAALAGAFAGAAPPVPPLPASALLGTGVAPGYSQHQAEVLCQVLRDAQLLLSQQLGPVWEVRTYQQTLPWLLSGLRQPTPGGLLDLSHFHVAVLWVGSTLAAAALLRVHGGEGGVLEVTLAATSQQLQHRQLGRMLVGAVERFVMEVCGVKQAWMPALGGVVKPCVGASMLPGWEREDGVRGRLQLAPGCSLKLLGLDSSSGSSVGPTAPAGAAGKRRARQVAEDAAQKVPKGVAACWALKLSYGRAANVTDWLQLTTCPLLRYSYVPFVSKHLEAKTLLPVPQFKPPLQHVRPPMLPPLPPQMQMQPHFAMQRQLPPPYPVQQRPLLPMHPMMPLQPHQMHLFGPQHQQQQQQLFAPPPHQQQQQQPMLPAGSGSIGAAAADMGGAEQPQGAMMGQQLSQQPEPPAAILGAVGGDQGTAAAAAAAATAVNSTQEQQQEGKGADASSSAAVAPPQEQQEVQQGQQQLPQGQPSAPTQAAPSKRQQWKEQVMQQFLAQQRGAAAPVAAKEAQAGPGAADAAADDSNKAPADVAMEDAAT